MTDDRRPTSDQFVTGEEQWWEFLDREGSEPETDEPSKADGGGGDETGLELQDVSRPSHTDAGLSPTTHSFRCSNCRGDNPADLPFCVHCGNPPPRHLHERRDLLVLETDVDETVREYLAEIFAGGAPELDAAAIEAAMGDPPAYFIVGGYPRQLDSLAERLRELGVDVRVLAPTDPRGGWRREIAESIVRNRRQAGLFGALGVGTLSACLLVSWWLLAPGLGLAWWLFRRRREWYLDTYRFDAEALLSGFAGLDPSIGARCRHLLESLRGSEVREYLSTCLMEYYALWHRLAPRGDASGVVAARARSTARDLIRQIVRCCDNYTDVWLLLDSRSDSTEAGELDDEQTSRLRETEQTLRRQLAQMASSLEKLRTRTIGATTDRRHATDGTRLESLASQVDDELDVVSETLAELEGSPVLTDESR